MVKTITVEIEFSIIYPYSGDNREIEEFIRDKFRHFLLDENFTPYNCRVKAKTRRSLKRGASKNETI